MVAAIAGYATLWPGAASAQERVVERHRWGSDEGRLMGYYSAALAFSPVAAPRVRAPWSAEAGVELSLIPPLSEAQRSGNFQKTENTNLAPVLPRPRALLAVPGGVTVEVSWVPPVEAFGVTANLVSVALARPVGAWGGVTLTPRLATAGGRVTGPITCNQELERNGGGDALYYTYVCHERESADRFEPRALSGELVASRAPASSTARAGALIPYAGAGVRAERTRFDVGVRNADGSRDPAHPILELRLARGYGFVGATWLGLARAALSGELFYAPGSLVTARVQAAWRWDR